MRECVDDRAAHLLHRKNSIPQALLLLEKYALTKSEPTPYSELETWYLACDRPVEAQTAYERGVASRDPKSMFRYVMYALETALVHSVLLIARLR